MPQEEADIAWAVVRVSPYTNKCFVDTRPDTPLFPGAWISVRQRLSRNLPFYYTSLFPTQKDAESYMNNVHRVFTQGTAGWPRYVIEVYYKNPSYSYSTFGSCNIIRAEWVKPKYLPAEVR